MMNRSLLLATDVDGTFIDEAGKPARSAELLQQALEGVTLVLASSRTVHDLTVLQEELALPGPLIAENGAIVALPASLGIDVGHSVRIAGTLWKIIALGRPAGELIQPLHAAAARAGIDVRLWTSGVGGGGNTAFVDVSGGRTHSLLLRDCLPPVALALAKSLATFGCELEMGGENAVLLSGSNKGRALTFLRGLLRGRHPDDSRVVAIGNAPNDLTLLRAADRRFAIRDRDGRVDRVLESEPHVEIPHAHGVEGWWESLGRLGLTERVCA